MDNKINSTIFKAYDIRGIYPEEINENIAYNIGRALIQYSQAKKAVIGFDMRKSSPEIEKGMIAGMSKQGANVVKIGLSTAPMLYFASWNLNTDVAVMVTASHNPAKWNGVKLCQKKAMPIGEGSGMEEIKALVMRGKFIEHKQTASVKNNDNLKNQYLDYIAKFFKKGLSQKKIVIDFANGMGILDKAIYEKFPQDLKAFYLYDNYDGSFPNHEANPLKIETLKALQKKVVEEKADLGIAYDGDADRIGFVDEKGEAVRMDFITALLAKEILKKNPGGLILADIRSSNAVLEFIRKYGGRVHYSRVGHSLIENQMRKEGAIFAGELSGHYFFQENSKAEMATLAALTILNHLNTSGQKMSALTAELKKYFQSGEINSDVNDRNAIMEKLKNKYSDGKLNTLDGIRIDYPSWWFNVRPSNTEPKLRLNLEAKTRELMERKRDEILKFIRE